MKDDMTEADGRGSSDLERALWRLDGAPVPPELGRRVLARAHEVRANAALTPGMRVLAAACLALIVALPAIDPLVAGRDAARLAALLDGRSSVTRVEEPVPELAEILAGDGKKAARLARLQALAESAARKDFAYDFIEARKRLKGWILHETSENPD